MCESKCVCVCVGVCESVCVRKCVCVYWNNIHIVYLRVYVFVIYKITISKTNKSSHHKTLIGPLGHRKKEVQKCNKDIEPAKRLNWDVAEPS